MSRKGEPRVRPTPQRTCVGCRAVLAKRQLIRIVRTPEGLRVDPTGKAEGRGAYLHDRRACWEQALEGALAQALRTELTDSDRVLLATWIERLPGPAVSKSNPAAPARMARRGGCRKQEGHSP
ncbi:MAG: YlxR family protein [Anaerolineales bacterium]|jgi:predicted RNA-binding protein YlxR (DUF448 family)